MRIVRELDQSTWDAIDPEIVLLKSSSTWFYSVGALLMALGIASSALAVSTTFFTVAVLGALLIIGGITQGIHSFGVQKWSGFLLNLFGAVFYVVLGLFVISNPGMTAITLTFLVAMFFMAAGVFRLTAALSTHVARRTWLVVSGILDLVLATVTLTQLPAISMWLLGLLIGIQLLVLGCWFFAIGSGVKRVTTERIRAAA